MSHRGRAKESIHTFPHFTDKETEVTWPTMARPKAVSPFLLKKKKNCLFIYGCAASFLLP